MDIFKLRLKIGVNEFEAEGSQEYVQQERQVFLESIDALKQEGEEPGRDLTPLPPPPPPGNGNQPPADSREISQTDMQRIASLNGEVITLTALPPAGENHEQETLMLLLLAHRVMRSVDSVPTDDVLNGMRQSGIPVDRLDRIAGRISQWVISTGVVRAREVATALLTHVG